MGTATARSEHLPSTSRDSGGWPLPLVNSALQDAWGKGWFERPRLEPAALLIAARKVAALEHFGEDDGWRERLDRLGATGGVMMIGLGATLATTGNSHS